MKKSILATVTLAIMGLLIVSFVYVLPTAISVLDAQNTNARMVAAGLDPITGQVK